MLLLIGASTRPTIPEDTTGANSAATATASASITGPCLDERTVTLPLKDDPIYFNGTAHAEWLIKTYGALEHEYAAMPAFRAKLLANIQTAIQKNPTQKSKLFALGRKTAAIDARSFTQALVMETYLQLAKLCGDKTERMYDSLVISNTVPTTGYPETFTYPEAHPFKYAPCFGDDAEFGIVTFIDLWLSGLWPFGVPYQNEMPDNVLSSPLGFAAHDLRHLINYRDNDDHCTYHAESKTRFLIQALRDEILSNETRSETTKKVDLLILFYALHENFGVNQALHEIAEYQGDHASTHFFEKFIRSIPLTTPYTPDKHQNIYFHKSLIMLLKNAGCQVPDMDIPKCITRPGFFTPREQASPELDAYMIAFYQMSQELIDDFITTYTPTIDKAFKAESLRKASKAQQYTAKLKAFMTSLGD